MLHSCFIANVCASLSTLWLAAAGGLPEAKAQQPSSPTRLECAPNSLTCLRVDIDGDGAPDVAQIVYQQRDRRYWVVVTLQNGLEYAPFGGSLDPRRETISLILREGRGDLFCRNWTPGTACGFPVSARGPRQVLYLSHSRQGEFVLTFSFPHDYRGILERNGRVRTDGNFSVSPAFDGPVTPDPWSIRSGRGSEDRRRR